MNKPDLHLNPEQAFARCESVEAWAVAYIETTCLAHKLAPPSPPRVWLDPDAAAWPALPQAPGRPKALRVVDKVRRSRGGGSVASESARHRLLHTFLHHEIQAAELMAWAVLRFRKAEPEFRQGLLRVCLDEVRHLRLYAQLLESRKVAVGSFEVRDWFWQRVPTCNTPLQFVSLMGLGVEAANLEHTRRFADAFEAAGDAEAAAVQAQIEREEVSHVAFGRYWFERWAGGLTFDAWRQQLPVPLSPLLMRGLPLNTEARAAAGMSPDFIQALALWQP